RHFLQRYGVAMVDAALADHGAEPVEEGDGIVALGAPVDLGGLERGQSECQREHAAGGAEGEAVAGQFHAGASDAAQPEAAHEGGERLAAHAERRPQPAPGRFKPCVEAARWRLGLVTERVVQCGVPVRPAVLLAPAAAEIIYEAGHKDTEPR